MNREMAFAFVVSWLLLALVVESQSTTFDVTSYGAKPDGSDISQALLSAWKDTCASTTPSTFIVPKGTFFLKNSVEFKGVCKAPIEFQMQGTLQAPSDPAQTNYESWVSFNYLDQFTLSGGGTFDGQGAVAWKKNDCNKNSKCPKFPYNLSFNFVNNSVIHDVTTKDSKNFHVMLLEGKNVTFQRFTISAPGTSINTDGIHIARSTFVNVTDSTIQTGDDCISIGDGTEQLGITGVTCGPGHGISVGSLGLNTGEKPVAGVYVKNCTFIGTDNGIRIKTWPNSHEGVVTEIHAQDINVQNVANPVVIDQEYCPWDKCNKAVPSKVQISKASFKNIKGSTRTPVAIKLDCSGSVPCQDVEVGDVELTYSGADGPAVSLCSNVKPIVSGTQTPPLCTASAQSPPGSAQSS